MGGQGELFVNMEGLVGLGTLLKTTDSKLEKNFDDLKKEFGKINSSWKDKDGAEIISRYNDFIAEATKLCDEIKNLEKFTEKNVTRYNDIVDRALGKMV